MSDPKEFLKQSGELDDIKIEGNLIDEMSHPQAYQAALLLKIQKTFLERTNKQDLTLERVEKSQAEIIVAQRHTNGDVTEVRAQVELLKEKDRIETQKAITKAIEEKTQAEVKSKNFLIPKLTKSQFLGLGSVLLFFGWDQVIRMILGIWHILIYLLSLHS